MEFSNGWMTPLMDDEYYPVSGRICIVRFECGLIPYASRIRRVCADKLKAQRYLVRKYMSDDEKDGGWRE